MSSPPKYRRKLEDEESAPLFNVVDERSSLDAELHTDTYPPRLGQSSTGGGDGEQISVNYTFRPRWPMKGKKQSAIGVLGRTKAETTAIVQRGFPVLAAVSPERIEFLAKMQLEDVSVEDPWAIVLDEAWPSFQKSPPSHLCIQIQDRPGDEEARLAHESREDRLWTLQCSAIFLFILLTIAGIIFLVVRASDSK